MFPTLTPTFRAINCSRLTIVYKAVLTQIGVSNTRQQGRFIHVSSIHGARKGNKTEQLKLYKSSSKSRV